MAELINFPTPPRMRGIKQAIAELHEVDPGTALTEKALRRLILTGELRAVKAGTKYLVNMDLLYNYLYNGSVCGGNTAASGGIRRINER